MNYWLLCVVLILLLVNTLIGEHFGPTYAGVGAVAILSSYMIWAILHIRRIYRSSKMRRRVRL